MGNYKNGYLIVFGCWDESLWMRDFIFYFLILCDCILCMNCKKDYCRIFIYFERDMFGFLFEL